MITDNTWCDILSSPDSPNIPTIWQDILRPASVFVQNTLRKPPVIIYKKITYNKGKTRKKRRARIYNTKLKLNSVIGSTHGGINPFITSITEAPEAILNAITGRLPLFGQVRLFGIPIHIQLTGVLYRHKKLTWIIQHSQSKTQYLSCHFIADITHILHQIRDQFTCISKQKKYNRQSFNAATCVFESKDHRTLNQNPYLLTSFGPSILQFSGTNYDMHKIATFLQQTDTHRNFFRLFSLTPVSVQLYTHTYTAKCRGWKTYTTLNAQNQCNGGRRSKCTCKQLINIISQYQTDQEKIKSLLLNLPSTLSIQ